MPTQGQRWGSGRWVASRVAARVGAVLVAALLLAAALAAWSLREDARRNAQATAEDHSYAMAAQAAHAFTAADGLVAGVARQIHALAIPDPGGLAERFGRYEDHLTLATLRAGFPSVDALAVFDAHGQLVVTARGFPVPHINVSDRECFQAVRGAEGSDRHVAAPVLSRSTHIWMIYVCRRLQTPDGRFMGAVMAGLSSESFADFYQAIRLDRAQPQPDVTAMSLLRRDMTLMARAPHDPAALGRPLSTEGAYGELPGVPAVPARAEAPPFRPWDAEADNSRHVQVVARAVEGFPVTVTVAMHDRLVFAAWHRQARGIGAFALASAGFLLATFSVLVGVLRRQEQRAAEVERLREQAERASRAKSSFLATVSHEVRTPLNGILGTADLLVRVPLPPRERELAGTLLASGRHLMAILNDMLDLTKIEAGEMDVLAAPFSPQEVVQEVCATFEHTAHRKGLALVASVAAEVPARVCGDAQRVRQVLGNLVDNAIKFTDRGEVTLHLSRGAGERLRFEVRDTGVGIPPAARARVFQPFAQADGSITRRFGGTGLGLAICRRLVALMDGQIDFAARPEGGTCFWVELPLPAQAGPAKSDPLPVVAESAPPQDGTDWAFVHSGPVPLGEAPGPGTGEPHTASGSAPPGAEVLVVEDNAVNALVVEAQLDRLGCRCDVAADGEEALRRLGSRRYDLVLMDCMLPGISGFEVVRRWRAEELQRGQPRVPIIALTANTLASNAQEARQAGMDDFLTKPCTLDKLEAALRRWHPGPPPAPDPGTPLAHGVPHP